VPRLGEVLGGLLTDVVRARLAADALTADALDAYRADRVLASMSVPRVTVSDMTVRLRFLVSDVTVPEPRPVDLGRAQDRWNVAVRERVLPQLLRGREGDEVSREDVQRLREALETEPIVVDPDLLGRAINGDVDPLADVTAAALLDRVRALSTAARRRLGTIAQLREELQRGVRQELAVFIERLRQSQAVEQSLGSRLQVEVVSDLLQQTPAESLQQLEVTVSIADVEELLDATAETER
jgi:hypothetical protein